jgi:hypothetical protein
MTADKKDPVEPRALTPADIMRIAETEGAQAADAALQRIVRAREALETEAPEAKFPEAEAPSEIESLHKLLGDLELGADEAFEEVEHLGELDAVAKVAVEGAIAKADAYEAQDVRDEARKARMKLQKQIRAARIKYSGGVSRRN